MKETFDILPTTLTDLEQIVHLFTKAIALQGKDGYRVWDHIDEDGLLGDITSGRNYKIVGKEGLRCIFSLQYTDPIIWRERDGNSIYLHRIVADQRYRGLNSFGTVLDWAARHARERNLGFIRMDTWADNPRIIAYYESFGFRFIEYFTTGSQADLPEQHRNLKLALLELTL